MQLYDGKLQVVRVQFTSLALSFDSLIERDYVFGLNKGWQIVFLLFMNAFRLPKLMFYPIHIIESK